MAGLRARFVHIDLPFAHRLAVTFAASAWDTVRGAARLFRFAAMLSPRCCAPGRSSAAPSGSLLSAPTVRGVAFLEFAR